MVSVIIPTINSGKTVSMCLNSIKNQTYPSNKIEIIVVDKYSTDNTIKMARKYTNKIFSKGPERQIQRNFGVQKSKGEYILFLDCDMTLSKNVIEECCKKILNDKKLVGLNIPERIIGKGLFGKVRNFERSFYDNTSVDAVRFMRKDIFLKVGGFDSEMYAAEDWDLDRKIRKFGNIGIITSSLSHHEESVTLQKYLKKKLYYIKNMNQVYVKKYQNDERAKMQTDFKYRFFFVFVENGKWRKLLMHPILAALMFGLRFFIGGMFFLSKLNVFRNVDFPYKSKVGNNENRNNVG
ncbi:MAG: glycosyltransferase [Candidatus Aenigmarchaeota archaeon]|nr:glycosyltransferase [Candidatus Aenigmarchaeota archaeon]